MLTLVWSFLVGIIYELFFQPSDYILIKAVPLRYISTFYGRSAIVLCFYPLAGMLADNKFGRYKTIMRSLRLLTGCFIVGIPGLIITVYLGPIDININTFIKIIYYGSEAVSGFTVIFLMPVCFIGFNANVIQFGMDQLHDSPADHQSLYIHWSVWVCYLVDFFSTAILWGLLFYPENAEHTYIATLFALICMMDFILLLVSVLLAHYRKHWFIIDSARINPYKLVYKVSKFARQHKVPIHRSAFTYCEDELPTGLDLAKNKYGGPFTTEDVENVKAFYGILKILLAMGPVFFLKFASDPLLNWYARYPEYGSTYDNNTSKFSDVSILTQKIMSPLIIVLILPVYLYISRRRQCCMHMPNMLKRVGIGITLLVISIACTFVLNTIMEHSNKINDTCSSICNDFIVDCTFHGIFSLILQSCLFAVSNMLIYIALYEFICAQSPHTMKGLLIGLSFAIQGLFQVFAASMVTAFTFMDPRLTSIYYYITNLAVGLITVPLYVIIARRYKYRQRDEICDVYRYAEEYYSKTQEEGACNNN